MENPDGAEARFVDPVRVVREMRLSAGKRVADIGAGSGAYIAPLVHIVGPEGHVYAIDVQQDLLARIAHTAADAGYDNVEIIAADVERLGSTHLKDESLDAAVISNALFQFEMKDDALREVHRIVHPGGIIVVVDWTESFGGVGPDKKEIITAAETRNLLQQSGFTVTSEFVPGAHHYGILATRN